MKTLLVSMTCVLALAACGRGTPERKAPGALTLPATLEGTFSVSVEKGDVDESGVSELNFGVLVVDGVEHLVQVSGPVLKAAGLPREGGRVKATLGSKTDQYGAPTYVITAMEGM